MCEPKEPRRTGPDGKSQVEQIPLWLRWALVFFISTNIISYVVVTVITVIQIDKQIASLDEDDQDNIKVNNQIKEFFSFPSILCSLANPETMFCQKQ